MSKGQVPATLQEAVVHFSNPLNCHDFMVNLRWPDGKVICPRCGSDNVDYLPNAKVFKCYRKHDSPKFSLKTGTVFEDSPLPLQEWLPVMWMVCNCKNGVSSWEIHRAIGVTQKTAWFMLQRARLAMQDDLTGGMLGGGGNPVEVDETYIGGKARNMHAWKRNQIKKEKGGMQGGAGKAIVMGMLERGKRVRATVIPDRQSDSIQGEVLGNVAKGATIHSDEFASSWRMDKKYVHQVVNHLEKYVDGNVHTNGIENFWSLLKRTIGGTYVSVEPLHLFRYVDEQAFRYNHRKNDLGKPMTDGDRFETMMRQIVGRRLTYKELTGKTPIDTPTAD
jgi:transposase-like protein